MLLVVPILYETVNTCKAYFTNGFRFVKKVILTTGTLWTESEPKYGSNESKIELDENIVIHRKFGESFHLYKTIS